MTPQLTIPSAPRRDLGGGVYALANLRQFVAFAGTVDDARRVLPWLTRVLNPVDHHTKRADYSFSDLVSLFVVRELLHKGVPPFVVRDAEAWLRKKWKTDRPFVSDEIQTDGAGVFVDDELVAGGQIESADKGGRQVLREAVRERLTRVQYIDGTAAYWRPMKHVLVDPRVQFGEPVIDGTRVQTWVLADAAGSFGLQAAARRLEVPTDAARAAIAFEEKLTALNV